MPYSTRKYDLDRRHINFKSTNVDTNLRIIAHIIGQVKKGYSPLILIVGEMGMGKSFIACWLGYIIMKILGKEFVVKKNCTYTLEEAIDFIYEYKKEVVVLDEMIEMGFRREWQSKQHHNFYKVLMTQRIRQHVYIMVLPHASDLDKVFAKNVNFVLFLKRRGFMTVLKVPKNFSSFAVPDLEKLRPFERIAVKLDAVPKKLWKDYQAYSKIAKENIHKRIKENVMGKSVLKSSADKIIDMLEEPYG